MSVKLDRWGSRYKLDEHFCPPFSLFYFQHLKLEDGDTLLVHDCGAYGIFSRGFLTIYKQMKI